MSKMETIRGRVTEIVYIAQDGRSAHTTEKPERASLIIFKVADRPVGAAAVGFPPINEGDEAVIVGTPNPRSGWLEVVEFENRTTGQAWKFNPFKAAWKSFP
jgi:hypothetical protein